MSASVSTIILLTYSLRSLPPLNFAKLCYARFCKIGKTRDNTSSIAFAKLRSADGIDCSAVKQASAVRSLGGGVAQGLERSAHNRLVAGSKPASPTILLMLVSYLRKLGITYTKRGETAAYAGIF